MSGLHKEKLAENIKEDIEEQGDSSSFTQFGRENVTDLLALELKDVVQEWPSSSKLPIVYSRGYNITFLGLEKLQQLDSHKFERIVTFLQKKGLLAREKLVCPLEASTSTLAEIHERSYLKELAESRWSWASCTNFVLVWGWSCNDCSPNKLLWNFPGLG